MKVLIVYPHGLGDCILVTPALRNYKRQTNNYIGFAMLERFKSSKLLEDCPYIDKIHWTKDAWNDYSNYHIGSKEVLESCKKISEKENYDKVIFLDHKSQENKIIINMRDIGCDMDDIDNYHTEVYISENDYKIAKDFINNKGYVFVHGYSPSLPPKNFPNGFIDKYIKENYKIENIIEVGKDFKYNDFNINVQFVIMEFAKRVCVIDSVFYHACGALDKPIDLAYFKRNENVYNRVKPLHETKQNIVYEIRG